MSKEPYGAAYLDKAVEAFIQAWPDTEDQATYERLVQAAVISTKWADRGKGALKHSGPLLTNAGNAFFDYVRRRPMAASELTSRFFALETVLSCWPVEMVAKRYPPIQAFIDLFGLTFNDPDVRRWITDNLNKPRKRQGFWTIEPTQAARTHVVPPLEDQLAALSAAVTDSFYARRWAAMNANYALDDEIPF